MALREPVHKVWKDTGMKTRREVLLVIGTAVFGLNSFASTPAFAEARYNTPGFEIDLEAWLEDSDGDLYRYFVEEDRRYRGPWRSEEEVEVFLNHFNQLVRHGIFDDLDCRIIWYRKYDASSGQILDAIARTDGYEDLSRTTYFNRVDKIRYHMRIAYGYRS